jgi:hypothetical protein
VYRSCYQGNLICHITKMYTVINILSYAKIRRDRTIVSCFVHIIQKTKGNYSHRGVSEFMENLIS